MIRTAKPSCFGEPSAHSKKCKNCLHLELCIGFFLGRLCADGVLKEKYNKTKNEHEYSHTLKVGSRVELPQKIYELFKLAGWCREVD